MSIKPQVSTTGAEIQQSLVELIKDYFEKYPRCIPCRTDSATVLDWIRSTSGYSQRLTDIFVHGMVEPHEKLAQFHEANQVYCTQSMATVA